MQRYLLLLLVPLYSLLSTPRCGAEFDKPQAMDVSGEIILAVQGQDHRKLKQLVLAHASDLDKAAKEYPDNPVILVGAGVALDQRGRRREAHEMLTKAWNHSQHRMIAPIYAESLSRNKQTFEAYKVLKKTLAENPESGLLRQQLSSAAAHIQDYETALPLIVEWEAVCARESTTDDHRRGHALVLTGLANCYLHLGRYAEAIEALKKADELIDSVIVTSPLAEAYMKSGETDKAKKALTAALKQDKEYPAVLYHTGLLLKREGKETAEGYFKRAYAACVEKEAGYGFLGEQYFLFHLICKELGRDELATQYRDKAAKLGYRFAAPWKE